ncbi:GGDEF domain-containing protein [Rhizobium tumorigenes]|nr:GGDEF domain-containing protein [Rhizobium tumorigenes]WFS00563.1 GGDEF domain-containing protein [Rhizobium tumorigenes]
MMQIKRNISLTYVANRHPDPDAEQMALDEAWALGCTGRCSTALSMSKSILYAAEAAGHQRLIARSCQDSAWYCFQLGEAQDGIEYAQRAAALWKGLGSPAFEAQALSIKAWLNLELGNLEKAIELAAEARNIADLSADLRSRSLAINVIGVIFWMTRQTPMAIYYCGRAVELAREAGDLTFEGWWLINLGGSHAEAAYLAQENGDDAAAAISMNAAIEITRQACELARKLKDIWAERLCLTNLAEYSNGSDNFVAAEAYLAQYREIPGEVDARGRGQYLVNLGRTLVSLEQYEAALIPLRQAYSVARTTNNVETKMLSCLYLSKAHEHVGSYDLALEFHKLYHGLNQQFSAERTRQNARMAEIRYETKKLRTLLDNEVERFAEVARSLEVLQERTHLLAVAADTDALTGLSNRRRLESVFLDMATSQQRYALAMIDIDHFKMVNDAFSHIVGDKVLAQVGALIKSLTREGDLAVRFGGEEFVILLTDTTLLRAKSACQRLRVAIADYDWSQIATGLQVTISIGLAISTDTSEPKTLLQVADGYLYRAKQTGRNRVVWSDHS